MNISEQTESTEKYRTFIFLETFKYAPLTVDANLQGDWLYMQGKFINSWTNISEQTESTEEYRQFPANIPLTVDTNLQGDLYAR